MDGYMLPQHAVSQRDWQRQPEREYGPALLQQSDETLGKKQCCKSGRGEPQTWRAVWRGRVQAPGSSFCWSLRRRKGHKVCLKCGKPCPAPLAHAAGDPEKGAQLSLAVQICKVRMHLRCLLLVNVFKIWLASMLTETL